MRIEDGHRSIEKWHVDSKAELDTLEIGRAVGRSVKVGDAVLLIGELGAGKTRFVQGMAEGIESPNNARSPTFVLVNPHQGRITLQHCDLYRISNITEVDDLGFDEMLEEGTLAVEWADRARKSFPSDSLEVVFTVTGDNSRDLVFTTGGTRSVRLLEDTRVIVESDGASV